MINIWTPALLSNGSHACTILVFIDKYMALSSISRFMKLIVDRHFDGGTGLLRRLSVVLRLLPFRIGLDQLITQLLTIVCCACLYETNHQKSLLHSPVVVEQFIQRLLLICLERAMECRVARRESLPTKRLLDAAPQIYVCRKAFGNRICESVTTKTASPAEVSRLIPYWLLGVSNCHISARDLLNSFRLLLRRIFL